MFVEEYLEALRRERYTPSAFVRYVVRCSRRARECIARNPAAARSVIANGFGFFVFFFALSIGAALLVDETLAYRLIIFQGAAIAIGTTWLLLHLGLLRDRDGHPFRKIGLPNQLSFLRLLMIPTVHLFIVEGYLWFALVAYALAGLSDVLDGYLARRSGLSSRLGLVLDPIVDVGYVVAIFTALYRIGWIPTWLMALIALRYVLLFGGGTLIYFVRARVRIEPTTFGRGSGIVITAITFALFGLALSGNADPQSGVWRVFHAALGFLFATACVQLLVIGVHNLRGSDTSSDPAPPSTGGGS
jgi:cardiolipin synthase